ncbi:MAG: hypothetical protein U0V75_00180 [Ferruginibacter sp.]
MKQIITLLCIVFIVVTCKHSPIPPPSTYMATSVVHDLTDKHNLQPEPEPLLQLYNLRDYKAAADYYRYHAITDLTLSPSVELWLSDEATAEKQNTEDRPMYRDLQIVQFYDSIRRQLKSATRMANDTVEMSHSECFKIIAGELEWLQTKTAKKKVLLIFSNLQENSAIFNVYSESAKYLLAKNPAAVSKSFEQANLLHDSLQGISVFFCYQPTDREDDAAFNAMAQVYKSMLESRGAVVRIQADNNHFDIP